LLKLQPEGFWALSSKGKVHGALESKDIDEHLLFLSRQLLPHKDVILRLAQGGETSFGVIWKSSYLCAGTGPVINRECIVAAFGIKVVARLAL